MRRALLSAALAALLGVAAAALVACGSSSKSGLIPASIGGPLQSDVEAVQQAAEAGNGDCSSTESALRKAKADFRSLPASVDSALRDRIRLGLENLEKVAGEACAQPLAQTTTATTPKTTSTPTETQTTPPTTSSQTTTTPPPAEKEEEEEPGGPVGGTPAPGEAEGPGGATPEEGGPGHGRGNGGDNGNGGAEGGR